MKKSSRPHAGSGAGSSRQNALEPAGLLRRLIAMLYDALLLAALWIVTSLPFVWLAGGVPQGTILRAAYQLYLLAVAYAFLAWFWVHGGQTLGMRAWRLRVVDLHDQPITWSIASRRFAAAILSLLCVGLGFLWVMHDRERRAWHDILSASRVVVLPERKRRPVTLSQ